MSAQDLHPMSSTLLNPTCPQHLLNEQFVGKSIQQLPGPAIIIDVAKVKKQCTQMLDAAKSLGTGFRAHVKTHKTAELSKLQVGSDPSTPALFVVSTLPEAEGLLPVLEEYRAQGRRVNVLYGIPPSTSSFARLAAIRSAIGPDSISFMIDHPTQLDHLAAHFASSNSSSTPIPIYIKTDSGYGRAGVTPTSQSLLALLQHAYALRSTVHVLGFYSHLGLSYNGSDPTAALASLRTELDGVNAAAQIAYAAGYPASTRFTLSVGATPTAVATQNLLASAPPADASLAQAISRTKALIAQLQAHGHTVELHAGVYPVLDLQQLATHARPTATATATPTMTADDIAIFVLAEVISVYTERARPEALVGAGGVALGREPCKSYPGWAIVAPAPWDDEQSRGQIYDPEGARTGWIVGRVAQEHGILTWEGDSAKCRQLKVGEKLLLWPNHACIACSNFGWVFVVDSSRAGPQEGIEVVEVWPRWRGW